jgi:aspartyl protease
MTPTKGPFTGSILLAVALALLVQASAAAGAPDIGNPGTSNGPPLGITPATIKLQTILDRNDAVVGRVAHKSITHVQVGTITAYGLTGTFRDVYAGLHYTDDFHSTVKLGPFVSEHGRFHGQRWRKDENGVTNVVQDTVRADENDLGRFVSDTENPKNDVTLLGEVTSPFPAYVVQVKLKNRPPFWSFYNKQTNLLNRVEIGYPDDREAYTYDDYRLANGVREAWNTHHSDYDNRNEYDSHVTADTYGAPVTDADLAIPPSRSDIVQFPAGKTEVDLPSDITIYSLIPYGISATWADPFVRVTINGQSMDMVLDSSESGIALDDETAKNLGLTRYAPYEKDEKGHAYPTRSIIPTLGIGDLTMHDVVVRCRHMNMYEGNGRPVVGSLGFDFLANAVVEIDYTHHDVKAFHPFEFIPPADSTPTPVNVDDGIPFVSAQVGNSIGDYFILRTTAPITVLFPSFWQAHSDDVADQGKGRELNFRLFYAQDSQLKATQLKGLYFGGVRFYEWLAYKAIDSNHVLEGVDFDGIIGCDFLEYFNVFFDYNHHLIYLEKNDIFKKAGGR